MVIKGNYAYLAVENDGIEIVDITDITNMQRVSNYNTNIVKAYGIYIDGNFAYLADNDTDKGLHIIDISNITYLHLKDYKYKWQIKMMLKKICLCF